MLTIRVPGHRLAQIKNDIIARSRYVSMLFSYIFMLSCATMLSRVSRISGGLALACWTCGERLRCQLGFILGESCVPRQTFREGVVDSCALKRDWRAPTRIVYIFFKTCLKQCLQYAFNMPSICLQYAFNMPSICLQYAFVASMPHSSGTMGPLNFPKVRVLILATANFSACELSELFRFVQICSDLFNL